MSNNGTTIISTWKNSQPRIDRHNVGFRNSAVKRLLLDLQRLVSAAPLLLLLLTGCSARVEVTKEPPTAASRTVVAVDVMTEPEVQQEKFGEVIVNDDLHLHQHVHFHEEPTPEPVQVEEERARLDERERLRLEHEARVRKWRAQMGR